ncbi:unnamed protein product [Fraxinus pennsylvanica]|uniref:Uncharacterized protein n=1 Tax=Fraxinus pennsylvanica TaxID=56036 RepID=A0AAD2AFM5_9LAMI|nr:unnamed protein product [Fraxinus pennsylvanica]
MLFCGIFLKILISQNPDCTFFVLSFAASDKSKVQRNKLKTSWEKIEYKCQVRATDGKKTISTIVSIPAFIFFRFAEFDWFVKLYFPTLKFFSACLYLCFHVSIQWTETWNSIHWTETFLMDLTGWRH